MSSDTKQRKKKRQPKLPPAPYRAPRDARMLVTARGKPVSFKETRASLAEHPDIPHVQRGRCGNTEIHSHLSKAQLRKLKHQREGIQSTKEKVKSFANLLHQYVERYMTDFPSLGTSAESSKPSSFVTLERLRELVSTNEWKTIDDIGAFSGCNFHETLHQSIFGCSIPSLRPIRKEPIRDCSVVESACEGFGRFLEHSQNSAAQSSP